MFTDQEHATKVEGMPEIFAEPEPSCLLDRLTERQRACLRLVAQGYSTKAIALQLGIGDRRAGKDIDAANRLLGVSSRLDAARLLADAENRRVNVLPGATFPLPGPVRPESGEWAAEEARTPNRVREQRSPYRVSDDPPDMGWPLRAQGEARNNLSTWQRVIWIVLLCAVGLIGLGTSALGLGSLSERIVLPGSSDR